LAALALMLVLNWVVLGMSFVLKILDICLHSRGVAENVASTEVNH